MSLEGEPGQAGAEVSTGAPGARGRYPHFLRAAVVGVLAGLIAVGFRWGLEYSERGREELLREVRAMPHAAWWGWAVLPAIGMVVGCVVGWFMVRRAPDASGSGIPHLKGVLVNLRQMRWKWLLPVKFFGGILGVGAGLSLGREGPTVQMGAAVGRMVADVLRLPPRATPQLLSCGAGAGLAAAFNAPLAGFLFVLEELHREMSALTFGGALVAAVTADIVARAMTGQVPSFAVLAAQRFEVLPLGALPAVAVLGLLGGVLGVAFNRSLLLSQRAAQQVSQGGGGRVPRWMLPGIAAAVCGVVAWWIPEAAGGGHAVAERVLTGQMGRAAWALAVLMGVKFVLTMVSYASGAPGGIFAPMLLLGALGGAVFGRGFEALFPTHVQHAQAFAVLGMAALFSGSVRAPLTGMVLILEMTGNYQQLLALSVACLCAYLAAEALGDHPVYEALLKEDLKRRGTAPAEDGEPRSVVIGVQTGSMVAGRSLREAGFPRGCLVVSVERAGREVLPSAELQLAPGDHITLLVSSGNPELAVQVVDMCIYRG